MAALEHQGSEDSKSELYRIRHSLAHIMAQAVLKLRPGSKLGFGPPIADGFYYDFILSAPISDADFPAIEKEMASIIKQNQTFAREELDRDAALARLEEMGEPYKQEYARELFEKKGIDRLVFYKNGAFLDMCEGPHVASTREIKTDSFKLRNVAAAYWRGDSKNVSMTRLYAWAFLTKEELEQHVRAYEEALARDHKKLGKELEIFTIDEDIGRGLPLWLPNGTAIRDELEKLAKELEHKAGYLRVATPHIAKAELYYKTGHLPYYAVHMYPFMQVKEQSAEQAAQAGAAPAQEEIYALKPMNCPHHHRIFASRKRSYRELPLRLAEYGQVYRMEDSGALSGLLRVRGMCMNDAHIYCTEEQIQEEFLAVMEMHRVAYKILGLSDYYLRFSTWDPDDPKGKAKYVDNPEAWAKTERFVEQALKAAGLPYVEGKGEAAFYGPKVDFQFRTVTGREETASTNQLDFAVPARLNLLYTGPDNKEHHPYAIHRAPLGTHERFVAFLIEHYGGAFPTWLAPEQVRIVTVANRFDEYGLKLARELRDELVRVVFDISSETMGKKIRAAAGQKVPNILVLGEQEQTAGTVTLRRHGEKEQETMPWAEFKDRLLKAIRTRAPRV